MPQPRDDPAGFIRANTAPTRPPLVPELTLRLATEGRPLWRMDDALSGTAGVGEPFWAFAWAGGQALARYVLDRADLVRGRAVLDLGAGSGVIALAAKRAGAARAVAADTDPLARAAVALNAGANGLAIETVGADLLADAPPRWPDLVLIGDLHYDPAVSARLVPWARACAQAGTEVLIGDPGRSYLPRAELEEIASYGVPTTLALEDSDLRHTSVWRFASGGSRPIALTIRDVA